MSMRSPLILATAVAFVSPAFAADTPIAKLHRSYEKADNSSLHMPEYGKRLVVVAQVLDQSQGMTGRTIVKLASPGSEDELARALFDPEVPAAKVSALKQGAAFKAECKVGYTAGSRWLSLEDCLPR